MNENLSREQNHVTVLGAITNDLNQFIRMLRVDPISGRLLVAAVIPGTTDGQIKIDSADTTFGYISTKLVAGTGITFTINNIGGNETMTISSSAGTGYNLIQNNGTSVTARTTINLSTLLSAVDTGGKTDLTINVSNLANDATFISALTTNSTFLSDLANSSTFITDLVANTTFLSDLANSTTFVDDLVGNSYFDTTLANSSTFISDLLANSSFISSLTTDISGLVSVSVDGVTITGDGTTGNPLVAHAGGGGVQSVTDNGNGVVSVDNTDPDNPIVDFNGVYTDGTTVTGNGTSGSPLVATGGSGGGYSSGTDTFNGSSSTTTIAHGLGTTPSRIRITAFQQAGSGSDAPIQSIGTYNGTNNNAVYLGYFAGNLTSGNSTTQSVVLIVGSAQSYGVATFDATDITITWTNSGGGSPCNFLWEAY